MSSSSALSSAVRKIKWHVLPLFVVMFIVNYIDRVNIGFVRQHLSADLGIGAAAYGLGAGLFFVSYAVFEVPSNMLMQRFGAKAWLTRIMITWGLAATGMAFVQGETSFYAMRLLLGAAEAGIGDYIGQPGRLAAGPDAARQVLTRGERHRAAADLEVYGVHCQGVPAAGVVQPLARVVY